MISGDYSGWNFGLAEGGPGGGLAIAAIVIAAMYLASCSAWPNSRRHWPAAGGGYTFARRALGPWGGFATGTAILIEYSIAPAAIATFIGATSNHSTCSGSPTAGGCICGVCISFIGIHLGGVGEALKVMFRITAIALVGSGRSSRSPPSPISTLETSPT